MIFLINIGKTNRDFIKDSIKKIKTNGITLLGVITNAKSEDTKSISSYSYNYNYNYNYVYGDYYKDENKKISKDVDPSSKIKKIFNNTIDKFNEILKWLDD